MSKSALNFDTHTHTPTHMHARKSVFFKRNGIHKTIVAWFDGAIFAQYYTGVAALLNQRIDGCNSPESILGRQWRIFYCWHVDGGTVNLTSGVAGVASQVKSRLVTSEKVPFEGWVSKYILFKVWQQTPEKGEKRGPTLVGLRKTPTKVSLASCTQALFEWAVETFTWTIFQNGREVSLAWSKTFLPLRCRQLRRLHTRPSSIDRTLTRRRKNRRILNYVTWLPRTLNSHISWKDEGKKTQTKTKKQNQTDKKPNPRAVTFWQELTLNITGNIFNSRAGE